MRLTNSQLFAQLQEDDTPRQYLRNLYKENAKEHGTETPLYLTVEARVEHVSDAPNGKVQLLITEVLLKRCDTSRLYEDTPFIALLDHINLFVRRETLERNNHPEQSKEPVIFLARCIVYRRANGTLDIGLEMCLPHRSIVAAQKAPAVIAEWRAHLITHGIQGGRHLNEKVKRLVRDLKKIPEDLKFVTTDFTMETLIQNADKVLDEYNEVKVIHTKAFKERKQELLVVAEKQRLEELKQELPEDFCF